MFHLLDQVTGPKHLQWWSSHISLAHNEWHIPQDKLMTSADGVLALTSILVSQFVITIIFFIFWWHTKINFFYYLVTIQYKNEWLAFLVKRLLQMECYIRFSNKRSHSLFCKFSQIWNALYTKHCQKEKMIN